MTGQVAQHAVDKALGTRTHTLGHLHRLVDGGVVGDSVQIEDLVGREAQESPHRRIQRRDGTGGNGFQEIIDGKQLFQRSVCELSRKGALPPLHRIAAVELFERCRGKGPSFFIAHQRLTGRLTGVNLDLVHLQRAAQAEAAVPKT